jgi:hypothetical protein
MISLSETLKIEWGRTCRGNQKLNKERCCTFYPLKITIINPERLGLIFCP